MIKRIFKVDVEEKNIESRLKELESNEFPELFDFLEVYRSIMFYEGSHKEKYLDRATQIRNQVKRHIK